MNGRIKWKQNLKRERSAAESVTEEVYGAMKNSRTDSGIRRGSPINSMKSSTNPKEMWRHCLHEQMCYKLTRKTRHRKTSSLKEGKRTDIYLVEEVTQNSREEKKELRN